MMQAKIRSIEVTEVPDLDPAKFKPEDPENFCCTFGLRIGTSDSEGEELFYLSVCTPSWIAKACEKNGFLWGRHHLIVPEYNLQAITRIITKFVESCRGDSWKDVAAKLSRLAAWEFEDYRKFEGNQES